MKNFKLLFILLILPLLFSACSVSFSTNKGEVGNDGGVYATTDKGDTWRQFALSPTITGSPKSLKNFNVNVLAMDPGDRNAVYVGTVENGLYYSYDVTQGWNKVANFAKETINSIAVDPFSKCTIYVSTGRKVYKSVDCSRNWEQIYYDNSSQTDINTIAIDHYDSKVVYIGTSRGEVIRSLDSGSSWETIQRFDNDVEKIFISPKDSRFVFVITSKAIYRYGYNGSVWESLMDRIELYKEVGKTFQDIAMFKDYGGVMYLASTNAILKSTDYGDNWSKLNLITPEKDAKINSMAVNPQDPKEIYYVTNTTFYRSTDGGRNWTTKKLPTSKSGWDLLIDFEKPSIIYLGVQSLDKK